MPTGYRTELLRLGKLAEGLGIAVSRYLLALFTIAGFS